MEVIIFTGIQGAGKSTFYKERFFNTHLRISLDLLRTRNRENRLIDTALETGTRFVIDNTNPVPEDRARYIGKAKSKKFSVIGYFFDSTLDDALMRNRFREGKERIPEVGIRATFKKLTPPSFDEGFDELFRVRVLPDNRFDVQKMLISEL